MDLPIRFRRLEYEWLSEEDVPCIVALMEACSDTLESLYVNDATFCKLRSFRSYHTGPVVLKLMCVLDYSQEASIDLSKVTKLKEVTFHLQHLSVACVTLTLKTITSEHRDIQESLIQARALSNLTDWPTSTAAVGDNTRGQWLDLERILIQLWKLHTACAKIGYYPGMRGECHQLMGDLLPEATKRGIVELVKSPTCIDIGGCAE